MNQVRTDITPLLSPESIAIVGASPDSWYTSRIITNLAEHGYEGIVYPVNPSHAEVHGRTCYDTLSQLPEVVDLAVISIPRDYVLDVVEEADDLGVPTAAIVSAGFSEADDKGKRLFDELALEIERRDIRVAGPQCIGILNTHDRVACTAGIHKTPEPGSVGIVSQSGGFAYTTYDRAVDEDINVAYAVPTGNEVDLTVSDFVEYMRYEPNVEIIYVYIEGLADPERFMQVADEATRNGTPIIVMKIGQSEAAEKATMSHSGQLTGNEAGWEAAFTQTGVERVIDLPDALSRLRPHVAYDPLPSNRLCIVTSSGGYMSLLADMVSNSSLRLPDLPDEIEQKLLQKDILSFGELNNPVDVRGYGIQVLPEIAEIILDHDAFDAYLFVYELPGINEEDNPVGMEDAEKVADDFLAIAEMANKPTFFLWTGHRIPEDPLEANWPLPFQRVQRKVPLYQDASPCIDAIESLHKFGAYQDMVANEPTREELMSDLNPSNLSFEHSRILGWTDAESLLADYGIDTVETMLVETSGDAVNVADDVGYPVAMKVDSPDIPHRTEADAVRTELQSREDVRVAAEEIMSNVEMYDPDADVNGLLIQPQVKGGAESFVGAFADELFGPLVTVAPGGVIVEVLADESTRIPPFTEAEARRAIEETSLEQLLGSPRDGQPKDVDSLAALMVRLGRIAKENPGIAEIDLNPVIVKADGVDVVDVLIRTY